MVDDVPRRLDSVLRLQAEHVLQVEELVMRPAAMGRVEAGYAVCDAACSA